MKVSDKISNGNGMWFYGNLYSQKSFSASLSLLIGQGSKVYTDQNCDHGHSSLLSPFTDNSNLFSIFADSPPHYIFN